MRGGGDDPSWGVPDPPQDPDARFWPWLVVAAAILLLLLAPLIVLAG